MKLREMMLNNNEYDYYKIFETFKFNNKMYKSELHYAFLNSEFDKVYERYNLKYDESFIMLDPLSSKNISKYMNRVVRVMLFDNDVDLVTSRNVMYDLTNVIDETRFLIDRGKRTSLDVSLIGLAKAITEDKKIEEFFFRDNLSDDLSADEIFEIRTKEMKEMTDMHIPGLSHLMASGGIKPEQLFNIFKSLTMRTRVNNPTEIYPRLIKDRWIDGLSTLENLYIESNIARKSMLMNKQNIARAGVHNRDSSIMAQDIKITSDDCGTKHYMEYFVADKEILESLEFKYYLNDNGILDWVRKTDLHLIGKTLRVRSALKCCSKHGGVCKVCFGFHSKWNLSTKEFPFDIGVEFSKAVNAPISQLVLSFKHNAAPILKPSKIRVIDAKTGEYMNIELFVDKRPFNNIIFNDKCKLFIKEEDILLTKKGEAKYFDTEFGEWDIIRVNKIYLEMDGNIYIVVDENNVTLRIKGDQFARFKVTGESDTITYIDVNDKVSHVMVNLRSTMKYLEIIDLYNMDTSKEKDIDDHVNYFMDKVLQSNMKGENITTLEVMFKNKVRDKKSYKMSKTPDWKQEKPDAVILSLERAINKNLSLSAKIPAGQLDMNFKDSFYHNKKNLRPSSYDILYENKADVFSREEEIE